jgi:hypothetical protein
MERVAGPEPAHDSRQKGVQREHLMSEKANEARSLEIVWVTLYSILVLILMMFSVDVPAR